MVVHHHDPECHAKGLFCYFQGQGHNNKGGTFEATARFQDSGTFQKAVIKALRCILSVNSHLPGFKLEPGPAHAMRADIIKIGPFLPLKC